jgi:Cu-Zn family superoxide dismutase
MAAAQPVGIAVIRGTARDSGIRGTVVFTLNAANSSLVDVNVSITGITQNLNTTHGLHVHMWGDISDQQNGNSMGPHWYIGNETHNCPPVETRHSGDMGNWFVDSNGVLVGNGTFDKLALTGPASIIGRGVVLHNLTDDCTGSNGNAGARIAMGVIGLMNTTNNTASNGLPRTTTGMDIAICNLLPLVDTEVIQGYAIASQGATGGIQVIVQISNITANKVHSVHIHVNGDIRDTVSGLSLGGHWDPTVQRHGMYGYPAHSVGDLGNIVYFQTPNTVAAANFTQTNASFNIVGGMYNVLGHGMVVHANRDNCSTPIGFSGARYAICVWGLSSGNFTFFTPAPPTSVPSAYDAQTITDCNNSFGITTTTTTTGTTTDASTTTTTVTTGSASTIAVSALTILLAAMSI